MNIKFLYCMLSTIYLLIGSSLEYAAHGKMTAHQIAGLSPSVPTSIQPAQPAKPVNLENPAVFDQPELNYQEHQIIVQSQSGATCGYHALFNGATVLHWLEGTIITEDDRNKKLQNFAPQHLDPMRAMIQAKRKQKDSDDLNESEIAYLAQKYPPLKLAPGTYTIVASMREFSLAIFGDDELITTIHELRTRSGTQHAFIVNTAHHQEQQGHLSGVGGHWIAIVVANRNGVLHYYTMDSGGNNDSTIKAQLPLLRAVVERENLDVAILRRLDRQLGFTASIERLLGTHHDVMRLLMKTLEFLGPVVEHLHIPNRGQAQHPSYNMKENKAFSTYFYPLIENVLSIVQEGELSEVTQGLLNYVRQTYQIFSMQ